MTPLWSIGAAIGVSIALIGAPVVGQTVVEPVPGVIKSETLDQLWSALEITSSLAIMREEGQDLSEDIARDYLSERVGQGWQAAVSRIYDDAAMNQIMRQGMAADLAGADPVPIIAFFESPLGQRIIRLEMSARRAFMDPDTEEAAHEFVRGAGAGEKRTQKIDEFIEVNDLIAFNVSGAMNTNYAFYSGLSQAELFAMSEQEILDQVWSNVDETRIETEEWLRAYLTMAYQPLSDADMDAYIAFSRTDGGKRVNRALFAGFQVMYSQIYRALGLAVARQLSAEEL